jgi:hypothetical protein
MPNLEGLGRHLQWHKWKRFLFNRPLHTVHRIYFLYAAVTILRTIHKAAALGLCNPQPQSKPNSLVDADDLANVLGLVAGGVDGLQKTRIVSNSSSWKTNIVARGSQNAKGVRYNDVKRNMVRRYFMNEDMI